MFKFIKRFFPTVGLALVVLSANALEVGDMAPNFQLPGSDGEVHQLAHYRGKQAVVLAWFPKAYTYSCTIECKSIAKNGHLIREYNVAYFMASVDPLSKNEGFAVETGADFPLLSDEDKSVAKAYGVLHLLGFAKRHTVYIGVDGRVLKIDKNVNSATSAEDIAATLGELGVELRQPEQSL